MGQRLVRSVGLVALISTVLMFVVVWAVAAQRGEPPYNFQQVQYARHVSPIWLALAKDIDFSRPDADEVKLFAAIMKSEGLPRAAAPQKK